MNFSIDIVDVDLLMPEFVSDSSSIDFVGVIIVVSYSYANYSRDQLDVIESSID